MIRRRSTRRRAQSDAPLPENVVALPSLAERAARVYHLTDVALVDTVNTELDELGELLGLSDTDIINRAITVYHLVETRLAAGQEWILHDPKSGRSELVTIIPPGSPE